MAFNITCMDCGNEVTIKSGININYEIIEIGKSMDGAFIECQCGNVADIEQG